MQCDSLAPPDNKFVASRVGDFRMLPPHAFRSIYARFPNQDDQTSQQFSKVGDSDMESEAALLAMQREAYQSLYTLKPSELRKRAIIAGATCEEVDEALDSETQLVALVSLVQTKEQELATWKREEVLPGAKQDDERSEASTRASQDQSTESVSRDREPPRSPVVESFFHVANAGSAGESPVEECHKLVSFANIGSACEFLERSETGECSMKCFGLLMGDAGAARIAPLLKHNTTVKSLDLSCNRIGADGAKDLADALWSNSTLTSLNLRGNYLGCRGVQAIAEALEHNTTLTSLNLGGNGVGTEGVDRLSQALRLNDTLCDIVLTSNKIGPSAANKLIEASKGSGVEKLDIRGLNVCGVDMEAALLSDVALALESKRRCMVLSVDLLPSGEIVCTTFAGNQVASAASSSTLAALSKAASASTGVDEDKLKFLRADGVIMCDPQDKKTLSELLSCDAEKMPKAAPREYVHRDWGEGGHQRHQESPTVASMIDILRQVKDNVQDKAQKVLELPAGQANAPQTAQRAHAQNVPQMVTTTPVAISEGGLLGCLRSSCGQRWGF